MQRVDTDYQLGYNMKVGYRCKVTRVGRFRYSGMQMKVFRYAVLGVTGRYHRLRAGK